MPSAAAPAANEIVVTTASDASNGDVTTVASLTANPGPDGISLREAIEATNNDPGSHTIRFAPALKAQTIALKSDLPALTGGGLTIEGSRVGLAAKHASAGLRISSSGNRVHALTLTGSESGVVIQPPGSWKKDDFAKHQRFADNVVSGVVMRGIRRHGIVLDTLGQGNCGRPCRAYNTWVNTTITDNTIEARLAGIFLAVSSTGDRLERATVTGNNIRIVGAGLGPGIGVTTLGDSDNARISDVLVARNSIEGTPDAGIGVGAGGFRAQKGTVERVRVQDNRIHLATLGAGIGVGAGGDAPDFAKGPPARYLDGNLLRDVLIRANSISGTLGSGVSVSAGIGGGGSRNHVERVRVEHNVIRSSTLAHGVIVWEAEGLPFRKRWAVGNRIAGVTIDANRIMISRRNPFGFDFGGDDAGVVLLGGGKFGRGNAVRNVRITRNGIAAPHTGIQVIGGVDNGRANSVTCVRLSGNRITGARRAVSVKPNARGASGNRAWLGGC